MSVAAAAPTLTFTLDLEDHRARADAPKRYPRMTARVLDFFERHGILATVFVVGDVAAAEPALVRAVAAAGHEVACHSLDHTPLPELGPGRFRDETRRCKALLEDLSGTAVVGYRAPVFSLTPAASWAPDVLAECGFAYSSSVLPARNPLHGFPGTPRGPFRWRCGLVEIPVPVARLGPLVCPFLGGIYLRYLPTALVAHLARRRAGEPGLWTYCHPYDFDAGEPYARMRGASTLTSVLLWMNRRRTERKLEALLRACGPGSRPVPFARAVAAGEFEDAPIFDPATA